MLSAFFSRLFFMGCFMIAIPIPGWSVIHHIPVSITVYKDTLSRTEDDILKIINNYRDKKGLPALRMNADMCLQAEKHSVDMASNKVAFGHDGFENRVKIITTKIGNIRASAENVAFGELTPSQVVDIWLKSPGHRKNIEGKYSLTGIGIATAKNNVIYFTQIFADK